MNLLYVALWETPLVLKRVKELSKQTMVQSVKFDLKQINFRQNLRDIRAFSWSTPTLVAFLQRI